jgi:hypothetical protein
VNRRPEAKWSGPVFVPLPDLPLESRSKMRVRFELTGTGKVWLDNVVVYDLLFPLKWYGGSQNEIMQLLQLNHAAKSTLEAERITDCVEVLDGYWPRFVEAYTPLQEPAVAAAPAPAAAAQEALPPADQAEQPAPGMSERFKRMMPSIFR